MTDALSSNLLPQGGEALSQSPSSACARKLGEGGGSTTIYRERLSPNIDVRPAGTPVDMLVLHYTGMTSAAAAIERLTDPVSKVSCHWLIEEDGTIWRLAREEDRAWHAGVSFWAGKTDINARSIGIELVNPGHELGYRPFPAEQIQALEALGQEILSRHPIPAWRVVGHSDVAPKRRQDPGELFDWPRLAQSGLGIWPLEVGVTMPLPNPRTELARIGYAIDPGEIDPATITAFQRHFRPSRIDGVLDPETTQRIAEVAAAIPYG